MDGRRARGALRPRLLNSLRPPYAVYYVREGQNLLHTES